MRIHITYTGGTIGMVESEHGLVPGADMAGWLRQLLSGSDELTPDQVSLTQLDPLIDSSNATPENWQTMIDDLRAHRDDADAFVVLHGTDTMSYSSAALSYALTDFGKPVIFTGSQHPLGRIESDAAANMTGALNAALSGRVGRSHRTVLDSTTSATSANEASAHEAHESVCLFFGHHLFAGNRVTKASSWAFEGFHAPSTGTLACTGTPWEWEPFDNPCEGWSDPAPYTRHDVAVIDVAPGMSAARLAAMLDPLPEAVLLRAYGVGNIPSDEPGFADVIARTLGHGVPVVVASQCQQANVMLGRYETGDALARAGAIGTGDMTLEAAYAKIIFLLSQGVKGDDFADWMGRSIAGEITVQQ